MKLFYIGLTAFLMTWAARCFALDFVELENAIRSGDGAKVHQMLSESHEPFKTGILGQLNDRKTVYSDPSQAGPFMLGVAVKGTCNPTIVGDLVAKGASVGVDHLQVASQTPCTPETIRLLSSKLSDDEVAATAVTFFNFMTKSYGNMPAAEQEEQKDRIGAYLSVAKVFSEMISAKCPDGKGISKFCESKIAMVEFGNAIKAQHQSEQRAASPEGLKEQACELRAEMAQYQATIDRENEVGKTSGVVDKSVLHDSGQAVVGLRSQLREVKAQYKAATKRTLDMSRCD